MEPCSENTNVLAVRMCKCGRAPHRKGQRNCHHCNRDANKRYKAQMKRDAESFREARKIFVAAG